MSFILDTEKVRALAKPGHARCLGNGIYGYSAGGAVICRCVWRALDKRGVNVRDPRAVEEAIGKEKVVTGLEAKVIIRDEVEHATP